MSVRKFERSKKTQEKKFTKAIRSPTKKQGKMEIVYSAIKLQRNLVQYSKQNDSFKCWEIENNVAPSSDCISCDGSYYTDEKITVISSKMTGDKTAVNSNGILNQKKSGLGDSQSSQFHCDFGPFTDNRSQESSAGGNNLLFGIKKGAFLDGPLESIDDNEQEYYLEKQQRLEELGTKYQKNEYNCHKSHHNNPKFKNKLKSLRNLEEFY